LLTALLLVSCTAEKKAPEPSPTPQKTAAQLADEKQRLWESRLPQDAVITLSPVTSSGGGCIASIDNQRIDLAHKTEVVWRVVNHCNDRKRVAVGIVTPKSPLHPGPHTPVPEFDLPFACQFWPVDNNDGAGRVIWCAIDPKCFPVTANDQLYEYSVCMNGRTVIDPEIRIKGDGKPPGVPPTKQQCPSVADKFTAEWRCGMESTLNGF
jgi:hypothetical protein